LVTHEVPDVFAMKRTLRSDGISRPERGHCLPASGDSSERARHDFEMDEEEENDPSNRRRV